MAVNIINKEHLQDAIKKARSLDKEAFRSLKNCFNILNRIKRNYKGTLILAPSFIKHSFCFAIECNKQRVLNGGVILHGLEETYCVELVHNSKPHWSVHT